MYLKDSETKTLANGHNQTWGGWMDESNLTPNKARFTSEAFLEHTSSTHPGILSHSSSVNLPSYRPVRWPKPAELEVVCFLSVGRLHSGGFSNKSEALWRYVPKIKEHKKVNLYHHFSRWACRFPAVDLTLANVACIKPWAIPGAHGRVNTGHSGGVNLGEFAGLLGVCQFIIRVT